MLWPIDSCQNRVSADQYHLTVSRAQVSTHRGQVFFEVIRWQATSFQMIAGSSSIFLKIHIKYGVLMCRAVKIFISNWPRTRKFRQLLQAGRTVSLTRWSGSTSNFYVLIGQNLTGEFMRKMYAVPWILFTLIAEADRVLCQLVMFLTVFLHWTYKWNSSAIRGLLLFIASLFIGSLVEKCITCQSRKSDFGWHRLRFSPWLMRKRVETCEGILALLDTFQESISNLMKSRVVYAAI